MLIVGSNQIVFVEANKFVPKQKATSNKKLETETKIFS